MKHYILVLSGGTEIAKEGPYPTAKERDNEARRMWQSTCNQDQENLFWLDVGDDAEVSVGPYTGDDLYDCPLDDDMLQRAADARTSDDVPLGQAEWLQHPTHRQFAIQCSREGFKVREYRGRNFYEGPAVVTDDIQKVIRITTMDCLWDGMGKEYVVYPKV